jgi:hypothetical protein
MPRGLSLGPAAWIARWAGTLPPAVALAGCLYYGRGELIDDAFVSFRYSRHLVAGLGLVFNPGDRVEGYTNFLWVMLLAAAARLGVDIALASQVLGAAFAVLTIVVLARVLPGSEARAPWSGLVAPALLALNPAWCMWAVHGLETAMFTFWALLGLRSDLRAAAGKAVPRWSALWYALATLTRPEGAVFFAASALYWTLAAPRRWLTWGGARHAAVYTGIVGAHVVWRLAYYGELLPNTFQAKVGFSGGTLGRGLWYVASFFEPTSAALFLLLIPAVAAAARVPNLRFVWAMLAVFLASVAAEGGDSFPGFRLIVPALPLLYVLVQEGADLVFRRIRAARGPRVGSAALVTMGILAAAHLLFVFTEVSIEARSANAFTETMRRAGLALKREFPPGTSIALNPAGAVPYFSGFRAYDMLGLNDRHIARRAIPDMGTGVAGHEKGDGAYILRQRPDLILLGNVRVLDKPPSAADPLKITLVRRSENELAREPDFARLYVADTIPLGDGRWLVFFRRRDFAAPRSHATAS